jgi:hypothetical protein
MGGYHIINNNILTLSLSGTHVHGFEPGLSRRIFQGEKILSVPSFGGEVKPLVPCRRFAACKKFPTFGVGVAICRQNYWTFLAHSSPFSCWRSLASLELWGPLAVQVGTSKAGFVQ